MDYRQTTGTAQAWRRAYQIHINNFFGQQPNIIFQEEDVVSMGDKTFNQPSMTSVAAPFVLGEEIPLLDPLTGESLDTTAKHEDLQVILYSLYVQLARLRDEPPLYPMPGNPSIPPASEPLQDASEAPAEGRTTARTTSVAPRPVEAA